MPRNGIAVVAGQCRKLGRRIAGVAIPRRHGLLVLLLLFAAGCGGAKGPERASVTGEVTFDGTPVESGSIAFIPDGQTEGPTSGALIEKGKYQTPKGSGPVLGTHRVEILAHRAGKNVEVAGIGGATSGASGTATVQETEMYIPEQYNKKSTLAITIKSGRNTENFELKSAP